MSVQDNISILLEAKREYNKHIISIFKTNIIESIKKLYSQSEELCVQENTPENILMVFQDYLSKIARWPDNKISSEFGTLKKKSGCDWLEDLIKMIYITNIKIMTMINKVKKDAQIHIKVPAGGQFYHLCILEVARQIWKKPYLFAKQVGTTNYKNNMLEVDTLVCDCIIEVIRVQMPVKSLVQEFIDTDNSLVLTSEHNAVSSKSDPSNTDNIKSLVTTGLPEPEPVIPTPEPEPVPTPEPEPVPTIQESFISTIKSRAKTSASLSKQKKHSHKPYKPHFPTNTKQSKITELLSKPGTDNPDRLTKDPLTDLINVDDIEEFDLPKSKHVVVTEPELVEDTESSPADAGVTEPVSIPADTGVTEPESSPADTGVTEPVPIPADAGVTEPESSPASEIQSNKYSESSTLSALLNPDELADLDIDLEELSIDNILEEKKTIKPITVKKPAQFMFFKNAPKYPG